MMFLCFMNVGGAQPTRHNNNNILYENLIAEIAKNDTNALTKLYNYTKSSVYGFSLSILKNSSDAEDVMQETYVKIFYAAKNYVSQQKPMAWILTIVRNLSLMKLRNNKNIVVDIDTEWMSHDAYDFTENSIDKIVLQLALSKLSAEERQIIILHSISGLKHREIALLLSLSLSTVLSKYHRGLLKLKKYMKESPNEKK